MLDLHKAKQSQHDYWQSQPTDKPNTLNSFQGKFDFQDPARVPELFRNLAVEAFGLEKYRSVRLDRLTELANQLWQGPGSCSIISDYIWDIRIARREDPAATKRDPLKNYATPTIDDYVHNTEGDSA